MPDLHPGKGYPIGSSTGTKGIIYPHLIGSDIGCGMSFIQTSINTKKANKSKSIEKWANNLESIDLPWEGDTKKFLEMELEWPKGEMVEKIEELEQKYIRNLGTIGAGNHFAEL